MIVAIQDGEATIPAYDELVELADRFSQYVETRKDHTCVRFRLSTDAGPVTVEFVRGPRRSQSINTTRLFGMFPRLALSRGFQRVMPIVPYTCLFGSEVVYPQ